MTFLLASNASMSMLCCLRILPLRGATKFCVILLALFNLGFIMGKKSIEFEDSPYSILFSCSDDEIKLSIKILGLK